MRFHSFQLSLQQSLCSVFSAKRLTGSRQAFLPWVSCSASAGRARPPIAVSVVQQLNETSTLSWMSVWRSTAGSVSFTPPLSNLSMRTFPSEGTMKSTSCSENYTFSDITFPAVSCCCNSFLKHLVKRRTNQILHSEILLSDLPDKILCCCWNSCVCLSSVDTRNFLPWSVFR